MIQKLQFLYVAIDGSKYPMVVPAFAVHPLCLLSGLCVASSCFSEKGLLVTRTH
jgi:hypothetical protein